MFAFYYHIKSKKQKNVCILLDYIFVEVDLQLQLVIGLLHRKSYYENRIHEYVKDIKLSYHFRSKSLRQYFSFYQI